MSITHADRSRGVDRGEITRGPLPSARAPGYHRAMRWLLAMFLLAGCAQGTVPEPDSGVTSRDADGHADGRADAPPAADAPACTNTTTDVHNCGACGHDCTTLPGVTASLVRCLAGACDTTDACAAGHAHCTADTNSGCETDVTTTAHCGGCNTVCADATPVCAAAPDGVYACGTGCSATLPLRCGTACVDPMTDAANCGHCGVACPGVVHGTASCAAGVCELACTTGYHACSSTCATDTDVATCGASCTPCPVPANGTATCDGTTCGIACNAGYMPAGGACAAIDVPTNVTFPSTDSTLSGPSTGFTGTVGGSPTQYFWHAGDSVQQTFARTLATTRLDVSFRMNDLTSSYCGGGATLAWNVELNGTVVGTYSFPQGSGTNPRTVTQSYTFAPIAPSGAGFALAFVATSTVCSGGGAWNWAAGGTATLQ